MAYRVNLPKRALANDPKVFDIKCCGKIFCKPAFMVKLPQICSVKCKRIPQLKIYLVGGAVRDELLGRPVKERDFVVVGSSPEELITAGFQPVGKDFPVFLHPKTHEEYALARTERKTGRGYKGFHFYTSPDVTLEEDLERRDLTINAMAKSESGELVDLFKGQADLKSKYLKHVSPAFSEDPVRVLRIARFAALLPDFTVHPKTNDLMKHMVENGEINALVSERVWKELSRALENENPNRFFDVLSDCNALKILFPALLENHQGFDALKRATSLSKEASVRFAALLFNLNISNMKLIFTRYRVPKDFSELALLVSKHYSHYLNLDTQNPKAILDLLKSVDGLRRKERLLEFILSCRAINTDNINHTAILLTALDAAKKVDIKLLLDQQLQGLDFANALYDLQLEAIKCSIR